MLEDTQKLTYCGQNYFYLLKAVVHTTELCRDNHDLDTV